MRSKPRLTGSHLCRLPARPGRRCRRRTRRSDDLGLFIGHHLIHDTVRRKVRDVDGARAGTEFSLAARDGWVYPVGDVGNVAGRDHLALRQHLLADSRVFGAGIKERDIELHHTLHFHCRPGVNLNQRAQECARVEVCAEGAFLHKRVGHAIDGEVDGATACGLEAAAPDLEGHRRPAAIFRLDLNLATLRGVEELLFPLGRARLAAGAGVWRHTLDLGLAIIAEEGPAGGGVALEAAGDQRRHAADLGIAGVDGVGAHARLAVGALHFPRRASLPLHALLGALLEAVAATGLVAQAVRAAHLPIGAGDRPGSLVALGLIGRTLPIRAPVRLAVRALGLRRAGSTATDTNILLTAVLLAFARAL